MKNVLIAILCCAALGGCGSSESNGDPATKVLTAEEQIKAIDDNPNMPADQKEAAKARLQQGKGQGEAQKAGS